MSRKKILVAALIAALPAMADTKAFRDIIGDSANIQMDSESLSEKLKSNVVDEAGFKAEVAALAKHIETLRADVEALDAHLNNLTPAQRKDWELAKTKAQLLQIFSDAKSTQADAGNINNNRSLLRARARGIASRAAMLQKTVNRLDR